MMEIAIPSKSNAFIMNLQELGERRLFPSVHVFYTFFGDI